jgi:putative hydrolase of the HAD superfamily
MNTTIRAVLFDADGVVILPNHFAEYLEQELHITIEMTRGFFGGQFRECLLGRADLKESIEPFLPRWGWHDSVEAFLKLWFDVENAVDSRMVKVILALRARKIICGLATNQEEHRVRYMKETMGFTDIFDAIFNSAEVAALKNDPVYYDRVTERLSLRPDEILFWDDTYRNVEIARAYGWSAEQYISFDRFQHALGRYVCF